MSSLELWIQRMADEAPHSVRPLLAILECMVSEAWERGCKVGSDSMKSDALMVARRHDASEELLEALEESL